MQKSNLNFIQYISVKYYKTMGACFHLRVKDKKGNSEIKVRLRNKVILWNHNRTMLYKVTVIFLSLRQKQDSIENRYFFHTQTSRGFIKPSETAFQTNLHPPSAQDQKGRSFLHHWRLQLMDPSSLTEHKQKSNIINLLYYCLI